MFARLERACAAIGIKLPANLSPSQRKLLLGSASAVLLLVGANTIGPGVTLVGFLVVLAVAGRRLPAAANAGISHGSVAMSVPPLRMRPAPRVDLAFDAYMRPVNELLDGVDRVERAITLVALLDTLEHFGNGAALVTVGVKQINGSVALGELPRMTKAAADLFADSPTIVAERRVEGPHGLHQTALLVRTGKPNVRLSWTVQMSSAGCAYRLDASELVRR
jgi:hypothetical protein